MGQAGSQALEGVAMGGFPLRLAMDIAEDSITVSMARGFTKKETLSVAKLAVRRKFVINYLPNMVLDAITNRVNGEFDFIEGREKDGKVSREYMRWDSAGTRRLKE